MGKKWSEIVSENPAGPLSGAELVVAVQGGQTVGLDYDTLKAWLQFKNNLAATDDPGVNDDSTAGYEPGSKWLNTNSNEWFICSVATAGAAVWEPLSLSADDLGSMAVADDAETDGEIYARKNGDWVQLGGAALRSVGGGPQDLVERVDENSVVIGSTRVMTFFPTIQHNGVFVIDTGSSGPSKMSILFGGNAADAFVRSADGNSVITSSAIYAQHGNDLVVGANGEYLGNTGQYGVMTLAADDGAGVDGRFYLENRIGNPRVVTIVLWVTV